MFPFLPIYVPLTLMAISNKKQTDIDMGVRVNNSWQVDRLRYLYLFMIVLYAGQSGELCGLIGYDHDHPIVFIIPILMTILLISKYKLPAFNRSFKIVIGVLTLWFLVQYIYHRGGLNLSLTFFHYYQLTLCYIIIMHYREKLFYIYEDIIYKLAVFSLVLWGISLILPQPMAMFFRMAGHATDTTEGSIFIYTMMQLSRVEDFHILRNAGFAWEPGRYACFLCLAIFCNFLMYGFRFKNNRRLWVLIVALFSTQSTTGLSTLMVLMGAFILSENFRSKFLWVSFLIPIAMYIYGLDFMGEKIEHGIETQMEIDRHSGTEDSYALDRIESGIIELMNWQQAPITGYGEWRYSYFTQLVGLGYYTNNGTITLLAKYGLLGLLYYLCIFLSSKRIARYFGNKVSLGYLILYICIGMGYDFNQIVLVMSFSFWGVFMPSRTLRQFDQPRSLPQVINENL